MFSTRTRVGRAAAASIAVAGVVGLSACNSNEVTTSSPTSSAAAGSESTSEAPSTSESSSESSTESSTSESSTESPSSESSSSSSESATSGGGGGSLTANGTTLKMNEKGTVNTGSDSSPKLVGITPTALEKQPDSIFDKESGLKKSNGTVYFLKFKVTNENAGDTSSSVTASSVNGLFFHPEATQGGKRLYGTVDGCKSEYTKLAPGESADTCYIYQISGSEPKNVVYNNSSTQLKWTS
ncbi:hypothetical protein ACMYYO_02535 [Dermacoccaceae bacterium W4C1]